MLASVALDFPGVVELLADMRVARSELQVVLYSDEITPGQQIIANDRKRDSIYWSLANFGAELLCFEIMWFIVAAMRVSV